MGINLRLSILAVACIIPVAAQAEFGGFIHKGCTKDNFMVQEEILWNCEGPCADTPLRAEIMEDAGNSLAAYPQVVAGYTKAQVAHRAHVSEVRKRADLKSIGLRAKEPQFPGKCNPLENILIRALEENES